MDKRVLIACVFIFLISIFFADFVFAETRSSAFTEFNILGCGPDFSIPVGSCFDLSRQYCDHDGNIYNTLETNKCLYTGYRCCPRGYYCGCSGGGVNCADSEISCFEAGKICSELTEDECLDRATCLWMGACYDIEDIHSCSDYKTNETCSSDPFSMAKTGLGTEICVNSVYAGGSLIVVPGSCNCTWLNNTCQLKNKVTNYTYSSDMHSFECARSFSLGECIDGLQDFSWTAQVTNKQPSGWTPSPQELQEFECVPGSKKLGCGEKGIKLPGFNFINLIGVFSLLFVFYFFRKKQKFIPILIILFMGLYLMPMINAAYTYQCDNSQQLYRIYRLNNTHVQMPDYTNTDPAYIYPYSVCFNEIFGYNYTGTDPHTATCTSPLFWVNKTTNSHVSFFNDSTYTIPVCFAGLQCRYENIEQSNRECNEDEGEKMVARTYYGEDLADTNVSYTTNVHVSFKGLDVLDEDHYAGAVCCKPVSSMNIAFWADMDGSRIEYGEGACVGQNIKLIVLGEGLNTLKVNYTIYRKSPVPAEWIKEKEGQMRDSPLDSGQKYVLWIPTAANIYKFKAKSEFGEIIESEENLNVVAHCGDIPPANITIVSPKCGEKVLEKGTNYSVIVKVEDKYNIINGTLAIGNNILVNISNEYFTGSNEGMMQVDYTFDTPGITKIVLDVSYFKKRQDGLGYIQKRKRLTSNTIVVDPDNDTQQKYVAACIKTPEDLSDIEDAIVDFDATTTRAINYDPALSKITNITRNFITFSWAFSDGRKLVQKGSPYGYGDRFPWIFPRAGKNYAILNASLA